MYIVKKKIHGKEYYYLCSSRREKGKVKTKTVAYLGKIRKEAEKKAKKIIEDFKNSKQEKKQEQKHKHKKEKKNIKIKRKIEPLTIEEISTFCKKKGFVFQSSDIYGGFSGFWDFGPLGVELFENIRDNWWKWFVENREDMEGIEASIISHPKTWKASGHVTSFKDIAVVCKKCKKATKIDASEEGKTRCKCGGEYENQGEFDLLFKTKVGALNAEDSYLRGETAQGMFMDFKLVMETTRQKLPFGIAQIGRCFRNEIAPRDFLFRSREFHIGELEFFIHPKEGKCKLLDKKHLNVKLNLYDTKTQKAGKENMKEKMKKTMISKMLEEKRLGEWQAYWLAEQLMWFNDLGLDMNKIKVREHTKDELSHYSSATFDLDYSYPFGSKEIAGNANRGQYDLTQHAKESKKKMEIFDEKTREKVIPRVIEPTFGMERIFLAVLINNYNYDEEKGNIVLKLHPKLAPFKTAIFPLINKRIIEKEAQKIFKELKKEFHVFYDKSGSIGRRYARQDEIGTPFCITIDSQTLKDNTVTIRERDTTKQIRVKIKTLKETISKLLNQEIRFEKAGKSYKGKSK
jgi:glycyl-tRNA synthetase